MVSAVYFCVTDHLKTYGLKLFAILPDSEAVSLLVVLASLVWRFRDGLAHVAGSWCCWLGASVLHMASHPPVGKHTFLMWWFQRNILRGKRLKVS